MDGFGLCQFVSVHPDGHGGIHLREERERAFARDRGYLQQRQLSIPLSQVSDGDLHRFEAKENGTTVRFWLYQKPDGKVATVFDACQICGPVGFYKGPNGVVCKNCAAPINRTIGRQTGGCNPIPLQAEQTGDAVIIQETDVAAGVHIFQQ